MTDQIHSHLANARELAGLGMARWYLNEAHKLIMQTNDPLRAELWATYTSTHTAVLDAEQAAALGGVATAVAPSPNPDEQGVYRRPPSMTERLLIAPRDLVDGRWQPREHYAEEALAELTDSIREHGVLEELIALVNEYGELELITGHRRKRAALAAGGRDVPVRVVEVTSQQAYELALISNDQRTDLSEVERGRAYEKIIAETGISEANLAKRLGRSRGYIQQRRALGTAAPPLQQAVATGLVSFTQARGAILGSGGRHEVQEAVLAEMTATAKRGGVLSGDEAQRQAEQRVLTHSCGGLTALGWRVGTLYPHTYIYAPTVKPAVWTSAQILQTLQEQQQPPEGSPPTITSDGKNALLFRGWNVDFRTVLPWVLVGKDKQIIVCGEDEYAQLVAAARADISALEGRFAAAGWKTTWTATSLTAKQGKRTEQVGAYREAMSLVGKIEKGTLGEERTASGGTTCDKCKCRLPSFAHVRYFEGLTLCDACLPVEKARIEGEKHALGVAVLGAANDWIATMPMAVADLLCFDNRSVVWNLIAPNEQGPYTSDVFYARYQQQPDYMRRVAAAAVLEDHLWRHRQSFPTQAATAVAASEKTA